MHDFATSQIFPGRNRIGSYPFIPCDFSYEYNWAEQKFQAGEFTALVARYENIPFDLKKSLDQLVADGYCNSLFLCHLFEASLLLLSSGILPSLKSLVEPCKELYADYCSTKELKRASNFVSSRKEDDIVILVLKSGEIVGSMTLYAFNKKRDMPSLSYLNLSSAEDRLLDVPALEVGRLAKAGIVDDQETNACAGLLQTVWIATAFLAARDFVTANGLLKHPKSYVCGDTYGSLLASLQHFLPIEILPSSIRTDILDESSDVRDVAIYFLQRQVLGSFGSADDVIEAIKEIASLNPKLSFRIIELLEAGLKKLGIPSLQNFDAKKFKIDFFYFPFQHARTTQGLQRLEKVVRKLAASPSMSLH